MSQIYKASTGGGGGAVDSVTGTDPILANGVSGVAQTGAVTLSLINNGVVWEDRAVSFSAVPGHGYFCTGALAAGLPASAGLTNGATIIIYVDSASIVVVLANTGQIINIGSDLSTSGGNATSSAEGSTLTLVYRIADTSWHATSSLGTWTLI